MKISLITVCYNSSVTIEDTVASVLSQDYYNIEYIVVDGGSTDGTQDIINRHSDNIDHLISESDDGIYDAMNKGIMLATGDVIGILNSDDVYASPSEISNVVKRFTEEPDCSVLSGNILFKNFETNKTIRFYSAKKFKPYKLRFGWMPPHPATFVRKSVYDLHGLYSTSYKISADYERFVKWLVVEKLKYCYFDRTVVHMRIGGASTAGLSSNIQLNREIVHACRSNGIYSNWLFLVFKIPFKLLEFVFK